MANVIPIRTEAEYQNSLNIVKGLIDKERLSGDEEDQLDILATLIEDYEETNYKIDKPDPIDAIKYRMQESGLTNKSLVPLIGNAAKVSSVLSGRTPLSLKMIRALHETLGIPADVLIKESFNIDFSKPSDTEKYPLKEMQALGWLNPGMNIKERAEELLTSFLDTARNFIEPASVFARKNDTMRKNAKMNIYSFHAWVCKAAMVAGEKGLPPFNPKSLTKKRLQELVLLSTSPDGPLAAKEYLEEFGVHLVLVPHLKHTYLDGAAFHLKDKSAVVGITARYDRLDNFWFTLLHELAHLKNDLAKGKEGIFFDDLSLRDERIGTALGYEANADKFAENHLQYDSIDKQIADSVSEYEITVIANRLKLNPAIVAGRYRFIRDDYRHFTTMLGNNEVTRILGKEIRRGR